MLGRLMHSRVFARTAIGVLILGLFTLVGLGLGSTSTTAQAVRRVQVAGDRASTWDELSDQINLEQDLMHSYLVAVDDAHRMQFLAAVGDGAPILTTLVGLARDEVERQHTADAADAYVNYVAILRTVANTDKNRAQRAAAGYNGELGAVEVRRQVSTSRAAERVATSVYLRQVKRTTEEVKIGSEIAFAFCLTLLGFCTVVLVGYQRRVEHQAQHDSLTGLANRGLFVRRSAAAVRSAKRRHGQVGLLLIDLDRFKEVNDTLGHHAGDVLLQEVAHRLAGVVRGEDTVARLGGDEFAVLLPRLRSLPEAVEVGTRMLRILLAPIELDGHEIEVSSSIGVAAYPVHCDDADHLMRYADIAMYTAKRRSLGVVAYDSSQNSYDPTQLTMSGELRHAIEFGELVLYYQPQVDARTHRWRGVEALVRWQHPVRGLLSPTEFIPLAEQIGFIDTVTDWALAEALDAFVRWRDVGLLVPVAVNISPQSVVGDGDLAERVALLLSQRNVPPEMLTLEITESALLANSQDTIALLERIRARGVRLSIDDFGTGYSSMAYLQQMPIDELKIDRCFVDKMGTEAGAGIVRAVLDLARNLGLDAVAEGVEDAETVAALVDLGCEVIQGFYFSRPLPADILTGWLTEHAEHADAAEAQWAPRPATGPRHAVSP